MVKLFFQLAWFALRILWSKIFIHKNPDISLLGNNQKNVWAYCTYNTDNKNWFINIKLGWLRLCSEKNIYSNKWHVLLYKAKNTCLCEPEIWYADEREKHIRTYMNLHEGYFQYILGALHKARKQQKADDNLKEFIKKTIKENRDSIKKIYSNEENK